MNHQNHQETLSPQVLAQNSVKIDGRFIKSIKAKADAKRTFSQKFADWTTSRSGSVPFLVINVLFFAVWIVVNLGFTNFLPFDPFPFGLLTMIVSLEAIVLAILVLVSQNREEKINDLRDETQLQLIKITEKKIIKVLELVEKICQKHGIDIEKDEEAKEMAQPTNVSKIEHILEKQIK